MNLGKSQISFQTKKRIPKNKDNENIVTEWLMRRYEADFGQTLNDWNILQITQLLKIQRTALTE